MTYAERIATTIREGCGGAVTGRDVLEAWIQTKTDLALVCDRRIPCAGYVSLPGGKGLILAPADIDLATLLHELAHHERGDGLASYLGASAGACRAKQRLARRTSWIEEAGAWRVVAAVLAASQEM